MEAPPPQAFGTQLSEISDAPEHVAVACTGAIARDLRFLERDAGPGHDIKAASNARAARTTVAALATGRLVSPNPAIGDRGGRVRIGEESAAGACPAVARQSRLCRLRPR